MEFTFLGVFRNSFLFYLMAMRTKKKKFLWSKVFFWFHKFFSSNSVGFLIFVHFQIKSKKKWSWDSSTNSIDPIKFHEFFKWNLKFRKKNEMKYMMIRTYQNLVNGLNIMKTKTKQNNWKFDAIISLSANKSRLDLMLFAVVGRWIGLYIIRWW